MVFISALILLGNVNFSLTSINQPTNITMQAIEVKNAAVDPTAFISVWDTAINEIYDNSDNQIILPLESRGIYNFTVDWGDGMSNTIVSSNYTDARHIYSTTGIYTISITGILIGWSFRGTGDHDKLLEIQQWGSLQLGNSGRYFEECYNLKLTATDNLNLTGTSNLFQSFKGCSNLGDTGNMNGWDVSSVMDMEDMFNGADSFNQPIGEWNVSSVMYMSGMFSNGDSFNQPIGEWDVSSVIDMGMMFDSADSFNQPIGEWNVSRVMDMSWMFANAKKFDQKIGGWDVSNVKDMSFMFYEAKLFDQKIGGWDISSVTEMTSMFYGITLSTENYDHLLLSWSQLPLQQNVWFSAGNSRASEEGKKAKQFIEETFNWNIADRSSNGYIFWIMGYSLIVGGSFLIFFMTKKFRMNR